LGLSITAIVLQCLQWACVHGGWLKVKCSVFRVGVAQRGMANESKSFLWPQIRFVTAFIVLVLCIWCLSRLLQHLEYLVPTGGNVTYLCQVAGNTLWSHMAWEFPYQFGDLVNGSICATYITVSSINILFVMWLSLWFNCMPICAISWVISSWSISFRWICCAFVCLILLAFCWRVENPGVYLGWFSDNGNAQNDGQMFFHKMIGLFFLRAEFFVIKIPACNLFDGRVMEYIWHQNG